MKKMMCKHLGGVCDMLITGNTPEEMEDAWKQHAMLEAKRDDDHATALKTMQDLSGGEYATFWADFRRNFEEADDI